MQREELLKLASEYTKGNRIYQREEPMLKISRILSERKNKYLTYFEIVRISAYVEPSRCAYVSANEPNIVKHTTERAFASPKIRDKMEVLMELAGIEVEEASFILSLYNPEEYPFINKWSYKAVSGRLRLRLSLEDYLQYFKKVEEIRREVNLPAYTLSKALSVKGGYHEAALQHKRPQRGKRA